MSIIELLGLNLPRGTYLGNNPVQTTGPYNNSAVPMSNSRYSQVSDFAEHTFRIIVY